MQNGQSYTPNDTTTSTEATPGTSSPQPVYHAETASCAVGTIAATPVLPAASQPKATGMSGWVHGMIPAGPLIPNGVRMAGTYYGAGGASIEFLGDKAIVTCRATLEEHPYTVAPRGGQLLIHLGGAAAVDLALGPDGALRGDASSRFVNGHRKTGEDTLGDPTYAPSSDTCGYGSLAPKAASTPGN